MKVYFTASVVGKPEFIKNYQKIIDFVKTRGFKIQAEHILAATEESIRLQTREQRLTFQRQTEKWIQDCDFMIAETSFPSISVGYEISLALQNRKPVLILYSVGDPPSLFAFHSDEKLVAEKYTLDTVEETIDEFIQYMRGAADTRFTFFITPQIAAYLDKLSRKEKVPKSVYLRKLIEDYMKANPL